MAEKSRLEVRPATPEDAENIRTLFQQIFNEEMSDRHWQWKYKRPPSRSIVVYRDGKLVAHYGGVGTKILLDGKSSTAIQITDLMVARDARQAVRSQSPFYQSAKQFLESYVGYDKPFYLAYGFPSDRAMALSEKLGLYETVGHMIEVSWQLGQSSPQASTGKLVEVDEENFSEYQQDIDKLWQAFSTNFKHHFICNRDADYFRWRYLLHPSRKYSIHLAYSRILKKPESLIVLRHDDNKCMLMDMLCRKMDFRSSLAMARQLARENDKSMLMTWSSDVFSNHFCVDQASEKLLPVAIPANSCSPGYPPEKQHDKWWFMPGDTDYL